MPGNSGLWVGSLDVAPDAQPGARLVATLQGAVLAPGSGDEPDYVLFTRDGSLVAQAFDMRTLSLAGDATQIVERVASIRPLMRKRGPPTAVLSCIAFRRVKRGHACLLRSNGARARRCSRHQ